MQNFAKFYVHHLENYISKYSEAVNTGAEPNEKRYSKKMASMVTYKCLQCNSKISK